MFRLQSTSLLLGALLLAHPASAVTFGTPVTSEPEAMITTDDDLGTVTVNWVNGAFSGSVEFAVDNPFLVEFTSIVTPQGGVQSAVVLDLLENGEATRLTTSNNADFCNLQAGDLNGSCDLFGLQPGQGRLTPGDIVAAQGQPLSAGTYRIGFVESGTPLEATAVFTVAEMSEVPEVPLPAGAVLLISGMAGIAALRRRRGQV